MYLRLYMTSPCTEALGPYKRFAIWVQGCNKCCKGCISPDSQSPDGGYMMNVSKLAEQIIAAKCIEGITISGGEPFLQQDALWHLIILIREKRDIGVIIYTGMRFDEISDTSLAKTADIIIDGEYIEELNDDKSLRGSSNQNVICLTERYRGVIDDYYSKQGRKMEFITAEGKTKMIGIPSKSVEKMLGGSSA